KTLMASDPTITATLNGTGVSRAKVQRWEARRAKAVLKKFTSRLGLLAIAEIAPDLDPPAVLRADLPTQRAALHDLKIGLGHAGTYAMLRHEIAVSERITRATVAASRG